MCSNRHDAEDLVQETFARVLARPRILRNDDDLGYLLRVMRNTFISRLRTAQRRPRTRELPEHAELVDLRATDHADDVVQAHDVLAHVAALPDVFRDAVVAVDVAGLSYAEAACALRTKEATITSRVHRGRAQVAQRVAGEAPEPEPSRSRARRTAASAGTCRSPRWRAHPDRRPEAVHATGPRRETTLRTDFLTEDRHEARAVVVRGVLGPLFVGHGAQKLFGSFGGHGLDGTGGFFESLGLIPAVATPWARAYRSSGAACC